MATEIGYHSDLTTTSGHHPTSERAIGYYTPRSALEGFRNGVERSYIYQLLDPWSPAEADARGFSKMENSFGLLRWDLSRKPGFLGLRNLMDAVNGDSAPVPTPGALRYGLEGAGPDVRQLLLRSSDGDFSLVVWREVSVWDRFARRDLDPGPDSLDVVLGERVALARRFDPVESEAERQRWTEPATDPAVRRRAARWSCASQSEARPRSAAARRCRSCGSPGSARPYVANVPSRGSGVTFVPAILFRPAYWNVSEPGPPGWNVGSYSDAQLYQ